MDNSQAVGRAMPDAAKDAFANFSTIIRVFASGGVALLFLLLLDREDQTQLRALLHSAQGPWLLGVSAALCGLCAYAAYACFFENVFLLLVLSFIRVRFQSQTYTGVISNWSSIFSGELTRLLYRERKARYSATDPRVQEMQMRMDQLYAWLLFLYCTLLLSIVNLLIIRHFCLPQEAHCFGWIITILAGGFALAADVTITRDELWLVKNHPQW